MKIKNALIDYGLSIAFTLACVAFAISGIIDYQPIVVVFAILTGSGAMFFVVLDIVKIRDENAKTYYIAYNHEYYLNGVDMFKNALVAGEKEITHHKKSLQNHVDGDTYKIMKNEELNIEFCVYELIGGYQLIEIKNKQLRNKGLNFCGEDYRLNNYLLIKKSGVEKFDKDEDCLEKYVSNDKTRIITINKDGDKFQTRDYVYSTGYAHTIDDAFIQMLPHWQDNYDGLNFIYDSVEEAREYAVEEINWANERFLLGGNKCKYFVLPEERKGTAYHEFQTGNERGVFWDKTSILLPEEIMEDCHVGAFFQKTIKNYNYFGTTSVDKTAWENIIEKIKTENKQLQEIIAELKPWAERSIKLYGYFTILGI